MNSVERYDSTMSTDLYINIGSKISLTNNQKNINEKEIDTYVDEIKVFEKKYSRFLTNNELSILNNANEVIVSDELYEILSLCKIYYVSTQRIFDPSILTSLLNEGYNASKNSGFYKPNILTPLETIKHNFDELTIKENNLITKPKDLKIDLGGVGKGYIIDKIANKISKNHEDFCINIGGDTFAKGCDHKNNYPYWAVEIENPFEEYLETPTLLISNKGLATSGINKRKWIKGEVIKNHIIDPTTNKSTNTNLICVTVIGENTTYCDVMAKTLLIMGLQEAKKYCKINSVPAVLISKDKVIYITDVAQKYIWKESKNSNGI